MQDKNSARRIQESSGPGYSEKKLTIIDTFGNISEFYLDESGTNRYFLGRSENRAAGGINDIVIPSPTISREHGKFKVDGGRVLYADLGSRNGTLYESDGKQNLLRGNTRYVSLHSGDMLRIQPIDSNADNSVLILYTDSAETGTWRRFSLMASRVTIGSDMKSDIMLPSDRGGCRYAEIENRQEEYRITDAGNGGGVFLNGKRISGSVVLHEKDVIQIEDHVMIFSNKSVFFKARLQGMLVEARNIDKVTGKDHRSVLRQVSCTIENNSFVAIAGKSGEEKNTLLKVLSGLDTNFRGDVWMNGIRIRENYGELKHVIGYVPAEDIVYGDLKLGRMLYLTAKVRMPVGTSNKEMEDRLDKVLSMMDLAEYRNVFIRTMSPEQRKKANIAAELLTSPEVLFLDEPTLGLDPGAELNLMVILNRLAKSQGITVIMTSTHAPQSLQMCDKILFLGPGGLLCFEGDQSQAEMFFGVQKLSDIYNRIAHDPEEWAAQYRNAISNGRAALNSPSPESRSGRGSDYGKQGGYSTSYHEGNAFTEFFRGFHISQFPSLFVRTTELITNNWKWLLLLFAQPLVFSLILRLMARGDDIVSYGDHVFYLAMIRGAAIWLGLFDSVREVNKERAILKREYMGHLSIGVYVLAKFIVLSLVGLLQAVIMTGVFAIFADYGFEEYLYRAMYPELTFSIWLTICAAIGLGLVISCLFKKPDHSMIAAPFVLVLELLFSGNSYLFTTTQKLASLLGEFGNVLSKLSIAKWTTDAMFEASYLYSLLDTGELWWWDRVFVSKIDYYVFRNSWCVLGVMVLVSAILCVVLIHRIVGKRR